MLSPHRARPQLAKPRAGFGAREQREQEFFYQGGRLIICWAVDYVRRPIRRSGLVRL
jgi:hypothetical protein